MLYKEKIKGQHNLQTFPEVYLNKAEAISAEVLELYLKNKLKETGKTR